MSPRFGVGLQAEPTLQSHRGLFQVDLDDLRGCIYHLGNPEFRDTSDGIFYAAKLLDDRSFDDDGCLVFKDPYRQGVEGLMRELLAASPAGRGALSVGHADGADATTPGMATVCG